MAINKNDIVRINRAVQIKKAANGWLCSLEGQSKKLPSEVLRVIDTFQEWKKIDDGFKEINSVFLNKATCINAFSAFNTLLKEGFLENKDSEKQRFGYHSGQFDSFPVHLRMLNDTERTHRFQQAIREKVTENDVVLDIGTGNGILAATAAMCGAKKVYAIERTEFIEVARAVFKANGLEDKITLIKGNSLKIELPEKATVLVSEIIGNDAFDEGILSTFSDAKKRLLTPNAKIIPATLSVYVIPMEFEQKLFKSRIVNNDDFNSWKQEYGIDFSPFSSFITNEDVRINLRNHEVNIQKQLSEPIKVADVNFENNEFEVKAIDIPFTVKNNGLLNGYYIYFESELSSNNRISLHPDKISENNHWSCIAFALSNVSKVQKEDKFNLNYSLKSLKSVVKIHRL